MIRIDVDPGDLLTRELTAIERENLPFAAMQATNATAFETREQWKRQIPRVFDRPTSLTLNAILYTKATKKDPAAEVFVRDEAFKGTPPSKYLKPQVDGGARRPKGFERRLQSSGVLDAGSFAVPGRGQQLDSFGNVPKGVVTAVLSALKSQSDGYQNVTETSTKRRRASRRKRGGEFFAVRRQQGKLGPGIYERIKTGFGTAVRSVFRFVGNASYRERYDIFGMAGRIYSSVFPFHFERELKKAIETSKLRGKK